MLELIPDVPDGVIGIEAVGKVTADDYRQVLDPAIGRARETLKVRLLYLLGERYEGYTAAAMWEDTKLGFHDLSSWERIAVVTDHNAISDAVKIFGWMIPANVRTYSVAQLADAKSWVGEAGT